MTDYGVSYEGGSICPECVFTLSEDGLTYHIEACPLHQAIIQTPLGHSIVIRPRESAYSMVAVDMVKDVLFKRMAFALDEAERS